MVYQNTICNPGQLTNHPVGSLRELWKISYPLMLSLFCCGIMIFTDRFFLAQLSFEAFCAASEASTFFMTFEFSATAFVCVAEMLTAKAYGAQKFDKVASPIWVMIWFSLLSSLFFFPLAFFGSDLLFNSATYKAPTVEFFSYLCYFGPLFVLNTALLSFWIGRGKTIFVTVTTIGCSLLNMVLDPVLIFGTFGFPSLGVAGAGLATGLSQLILSGVLFVAFFSKENRTKFSTINYRFDRELFKEAVNLGLFQAISLFVQYSAWSFFFRVMGQTSQEHLFISGFSQTILYLFGFAIEAVSKAAAAIVSNLIGARRYDLIKSVYRAGIRLHCILGVLVGIFLFLTPDSMWRMFFSGDTAIPDHMFQTLKLSMVWIWLIFFGEALLFLWSGILMAFGDSKFLFVVSSISVWVLGIFPAYIAATVYHQPAHMICAIASLYYLGAGLFFYFRVKQRLQDQFQPWQPTYQVQAV